MITKIKILVCYFIFGLGAINFIVFWILNVYLGGDAVNGKAQGGHFFLMSHGRYTEVSEAIFIYSKWHAYSVWITHPLAMIAAYFAQHFKKK